MALSSRSALRRRATPRTEGPVPVVGRDHALSLQRFLGWLHVFGGLTLLAAYGAGDGTAALHVGGAATVLSALAMVQIVTGVWWVLRAGDLRWLFVRQPGAFVAGTVVAAVLVAAFGGANADSLWVTSAEIWLIAAGCALPGRRIFVATALASAAVATVWVAYEREAGGHHADGNLWSAMVGLVAIMLAGLWMGRLTGGATANLSRWHLVELHELGLIDRLRMQLQRVDAVASALSTRLRDAASSVEVADLRRRLQYGVSVSRGATASTLGELVDELITEQAHVDGALPIVPRFERGAEQAGLTSIAADTLDAVLRRQLANVARHAPNATEIRLEGRIDDGVLEVRIEDDGAGRLPDRDGIGTKWSARQLERVRGTARYYAGDDGLGFAVELPLSASALLSKVPEQSIGGGLERFSAGMLTALRLAGYVGDSITAYAYSDTIGAWWLLMPGGAVVIELVLRFAGLPARRFSYRTRLLLGACATIVLTALLALPAGSADAVIPGTTSIVVIANVLLVSGVWWWAALFAVRFAVLLPLLDRTDGGALQLVLIYPIGLSLLVGAMVRFERNAGQLEERVASAMGRAALAGAAVRGLALRHDAVAALPRLAAADAAVASDVPLLDAELDELTAIVSGSFDPRDVMLTGMRAAIELPVTLRHAESTDALLVRDEAVASAVDRITLIELAGLVAAERASCAPPGALGRRRLRGLEVDWDVRTGTAEVALTVRAVPTLTSPRPTSTARLVEVADALGISVRSERDAVVLLYAQS